MYEAHVVRSDARERLTHDSETVAAAIERRMVAYAEGLVALRGFFEDEPHPTRDRFAAFVRSLQVPARYPGIQVLSFSSTVEPFETRALTASVRGDVARGSEPYPLFRIHPTGGVPRRRVVVTYLEPVAGNAAAFGYDLLSEPRRRDAVARTEATGQVAATAPVQLVQDRPHQRGFLLALAVRDIGGPLASTRTGRMQGVVTAAFRGRDLFGGLAQTLPRDIAIEVYDTGPATATRHPALTSANRLYAASTPQGDRGVDDVHATVVTIPVDGRRWAVRVASRLGGATAGAQAPWIVALGGLFGSVLAAWLFFTLSRGRALAESLARDMTRDLEQRTGELEESTEALARSNSELAEAELRFRTAFDDAPIGFALVAPDGACLRVNRALCDITGFAEGELMARPFSALTHPDDRGVDDELLAEVLAGGTPGYATEKRCIGSDGHTIWTYVSVSRVDDERGTPSYLIVQLLDITERKRHERELEYLADHDPLTGLVNRRRFASEVSRRLAHEERYGGTSAVLIIDLDHFKEVNDSLGHRTGDEVIRGIARVLRDRLRATDVLARLGGDEFAVLLPEADADNATIIGNELIAAIRTVVIPVATEQVRISASIGATISNDHVKPTEDDLMVAGDIALYEAKAAGRDAVCVYRSADESRKAATDRLAWSDRIRDALTHDRFVLHYQPICDTRTGQVRHFEALIRMVDRKDQSLVGPQAFLYIAERYGLLAAIDRWVVRRAIATLADRRVPADVQLSVNISARSLGDTVLVELIEREIAEFGVDPQRLILEVTETVAVSNIEAAQLFARRLTRLGCRLALDDFGTGFGSFYYLKRLPYHYIKIDGDFIRSLTTSPNDRLVVRALAQVASGMGKETIAEWVADRETLDLVRELGIDFAQGHHIAAAQPLEEALTILDTAPG